MDLQELELNRFFNTFRCRLLQETSNSNKNKQHFFIAIDVSRYLEGNSAIIKYVKAHQDKYPLNDLSPESVVYIREDKDFEYLWVGTMMKDEPLFIKRMNYLKTNLNNHLSILWVGDPYDKESHLINQMEVRVEQIKNVASGIKNEIKGKIKQNAPVLKDKLKSIKTLIKK